MRWIKENPTLAAGIGLPFLLIIFFSLASGLPKLFIDPPKYDVLFTANSSTRDSDYDFRYDIANGKLQAEFRKKQKDHHNAVPSLYLYTAKTGAVKQIIVKPLETPTDNWHPFTIPEVENLKLDKNTIAPDGYTATRPENFRSGDFTGIFMRPDYRNGLVISKNGRTVSIKPTPDDVRWYYYDMRFLGWVITE